MLVERIMTRNPVAVAPSDTLRRAIMLMKEGMFRRLPVLEDGQLVGIVTDRDIRLAANSPVILRERWQDEYLLDHVKVEACMTPDPITVRPDTGVVEAAKLMRRRKVGGLPVLQEDKLIGMVTETDILNVFIELLERGSVA